MERMSYRYKFLFYFSSIYANLGRDEEDKTSFLFVMAFFVDMWLATFLVLFIVFHVCWARFSWRISRDFATSADRQVEKLGIDCDWAHFTCTREAVGVNLTHKKPSQQCAMSIRCWWTLEHCGHQCETTALLVTIATYTLTVPRCLSQLHVQQ